MSHWHLLYRKIVLQRWPVFKASREYKLLRQRWADNPHLSGIKRGQPGLISEAFWSWQREEGLPPEGPPKPGSFWRFAHDCARVADRCGFVPWLAQRAVADPDFVPNPCSDVVSSVYPLWYLVVPEGIPPDHLTTLAQAALQAGASVRAADRNTTFIVPGFPGGPLALPSDWDWGGLRVAVECPLDLPSRVAASLAREALQMSRQLLRRLGLPVPERASRQAANAIEACLQTVIWDSAEDLKLILEMAVGLGIPIVQTPGRSSIATPRLSGTLSPHLISAVVVSPVAANINAASEAMCAAVGKGRELCRLVGRQVGRRMRYAPVLDQTGALRLDEEALERGEAYDIVDGVWGEETLGGEDSFRRQQVLKRRHRARKHLEDLGIRKP